MNKIVKEKALDYLMLIGQMTMAIRVLSSPVQVLNDNPPYDNELLRELCVDLKRIALAEVVDEPVPLKKEYVDQEKEPDEFFDYEVGFDEVINDYELTTLS